MKVVEDLDSALQMMDLMHMLSLRVDDGVEHALLHCCCLMRMRRGMERLLLLSVQEQQGKESV